jgi:hypothetical protein
MAVATGRWRLAGSPWRPTINSHLIPSHLRVVIPVNKNL